MITAPDSLVYPFGRLTPAGIACAPDTVPYEDEATIPDSFFDETRDQSQAKATIVSKYFWAWASVIIPTAKNWQKKIAYIDLFAGPGPIQGRDSLNAAVGASPGD